MASLKTQKPQPIGCGFAVKICDKTKTRRELKQTSLRVRQLTQHRA
jgi:hypothetical protein